MWWLAGFGILGPGWLFLSPYGLALNPITWRLPREPFLAVHPDQENSSLDRSIAVEFSRQRGWSGADAYVRTSLGEADLFHAGQSGASATCWIGIVTNGDKINEQNYLLIRQLVGGTLVAVSDLNIGSLTSVGSGTSFTLRIVRSRYFKNALICIQELGGGPIAHVMSRLYELSAPDLRLNEIWRAGASTSGHYHNSYEESVEYSFWMIQRGLLNAIPVEWKSLNDYGIGKCTAHLIFGWSRSVQGYVLRAKVGSCPQVDLD